MFICCSEKQSSTSNSNQEIAILCVYTYVERQIEKSVTSSINTIWLLVGSCQNQVLPQVQSIESPLLKSQKQLGWTNAKMHYPLTLYHQRNTEKSKELKKKLH